MNCYERLLNFGYEGTSKEFDAYKENIKNPVIKAVEQIKNPLDEALTYLEDIFIKIKNGVATTLEYIILLAVLIALAFGLYFLNNLIKK
jgi:hypothetical protein